MHHARKFFGIRPETKAVILFDRSGLSNMKTSQLPDSIINEAEEWAERTLRSPMTQTITAIKNNPETLLQGGAYIGGTFMLGGALAKPSKNSTRKAA